MASDDYVDAFEKILRLGFKGKADREVSRVIVDCCMQEGVYNPFYALLAARLCGHEKGHKFSLQVRGGLGRRLGEDGWIGGWGGGVGEGRGGNGFFLGERGSMEVGEQGFVAFGVGGKSLAIYRRGK